jgi:peptide chain release factor 1
VSLGNVVDKLLNQYSLSDTSSSEESNLSSTSVRGEEIDDLDTGLENFGSGRLVDECGRVGVNGAGSDGLDRTTFIDGFTDNVDDTSETSRSDGDLDRSSSVDNFLSTNETLSS